MDHFSSNFAEKQGIICLFKSVKLRHFNEVQKLYDESADRNHDLRKVLAQHCFRHVRHVMCSESFMNV